MEGFYRLKEDGARITHKSKLFQAWSPSLIGRRAEGEEAGFIGRLYQVLIRKFQTNWFKILLQGEAKTTVRLVNKFWFDMAWQK